MYESTLMRKLSRLLRGNDKETGDIQKLIIRNKEIYDGAIPSGNSVSAYNYIRLSRILSKPEYEDISHKIIDSFSSNLNRYSSGYTMLLHTLDFIEGPSYEVIVVGNKTNSTEIMNSLYNYNQFNKIIIFKDEDEKLHSDFKFLEQVNMFYNA